MKKVRIVSYLKCTIEDSDQSARMRRLIWIFSRRKCPKLLFLTLWFKLWRLSASNEYVHEARAFILRKRSCKIYLSTSDSGKVIDLIEFQDKYGIKQMYPNIYSYTPDKEILDLALG